MKNESDIELNGHFSLSVSALGQRQVLLSVFAEANAAWESRNPSELMARTVPWCRAVGGACTFGTVPTLNDHHGTVPTVLLPGAVGISDL